MPLSIVSQLGSIESYLAPFTSLHQLTSVDAVVVAKSDPWNGESLAILRETHQNLSRVLIHGDTFYQWVFTDEYWKARPVSRFSPWDIIRGACDKA